ncbi:hypothetical protein [Nocardia mangyaensis]|uniref:hypothetical protein n=1 Tax=Nocardia mangyaensis TaxID=2213200 RepID=UPI00267503A1|nr:hypothetical protein [Nocardia mangyaensis]MDO3650741.1 hypothetical protein [Nocardia mangyaensis]
MSSGSDDRRNDPTMFGGFGAPNQPDDPWQRPPDGSAAGQQNPGAPDPTAVWQPGGTGLPPGLSWEGSGPPPGLPDATQWSPDQPQASWSPAGPQDHAAQQADPTQLHQPTANPAGDQQADPTQLRSPATPWPGTNPPADRPWQPGQADPTQLRNPAAQWPGSNPVGGQADPNQQWAGGQQPWGAPPQWNPGQQWNPAAGQPNPGQPWGQPGPAMFGAPAWQQPPTQQPPHQQYGEIPALEHGGAQSFGQPFPPGPPKSGGKAGIWVAVGIAAVLIGGTALAAVAVSRSDDAPDTAAGASATPSMVSALSTTPAPSATSAPTATTITPTGAAVGQEPLIERLPGGGLPRPRRRLRRAAELERRHRIDHRWFRRAAR